MRRMSSFIAEDTNQFGPGTDLIVSLLAILLVMVMIVGYLYTAENKEKMTAKAAYEEEKNNSNRLAGLYNEAKQKNEVLESGHFKTAIHSFIAADFESYPVTALSNPPQTYASIDDIAQQYQELQHEYPYVFIIGHSNWLDDPRAQDKSYRARLERNWEYAGRRAALIAGLLQEHLTDSQKDKLVVVTTGEFDLKNTETPYSAENAWVEVIFGKEWKLPARTPAP